ncbi:uncharacterized protein [Panulirus ornatus]|uniref:uncharacterized protein n=1 Tax=Panulirus ornatus TaxID=150431 RepID=UPI003A86AF95
MIFGDLNARFGHSVYELPVSLEQSQCSYPSIPDPLPTPNENARVLLGICKDENLFVLNNLKMGYVFAFNHAPISVVLQQPSFDLNCVHSRASLLGDHAVLHTQGQGILVSKPIKLDSIDLDKFSDVLTQRDLPLIVGDIDSCAQNVSAVLYECVNTSRVPTRAPAHDILLGRWERLLGSNDDGQIWRAIDWRGGLNPTTSLNDDTPTDSEFKEYIEHTMNPPNADNIELESLHTDVYMPVLDDPITTQEVTDQIRRLKTNLFMIFKRGLRSQVSNDRGISVIAKLYDMILCRRQSEWFCPYREQAGAQAGRGCLVRLFTDLARKKNIELFVTFVDFGKAYDRVRRDVLFLALKRLGCGIMTILLSIIAMYRVTDCVIGTALVTVSIGVGQAGFSNLRFVLYVNHLIHMIKQDCGYDGFWGWLHILFLMDDTVLLSTSKHSMICNLKMLSRFCTTHGMKMNNSKTKFFVINGTQDDKEQMVVVDDIVVEACERWYVYLGSPFTADGSHSTAVKVHAEKEICHVLKFIAFVNKNNDIPFYVKRKVFEAALTSSLLYGCESWLNGGIKPVNRLYMWCIKQLLGGEKDNM